MAVPVETFLDVQQMCDYVLLKHVNVGKDAENDKLYKKWTKLWVVVHAEVSPLDCFLGYCKKENKWLHDNQAIVKYTLNDFILSRTSTKKHDKVVVLDFPSISVELSFDSQTKLDHYYQLLRRVFMRYHVDLVRAPSHPDKEGDYIIEGCAESYKVWKALSDRRGKLCWEWNLRVIRRIHYHKNVAKLEVEAGRSSETGEGHFFFTGRHATRLFEAMKAELMARARQKQQPRSLPSHEPTKSNLTRSSSHIGSSNLRVSDSPLHKPLARQLSHTDGVLPSRGGMSVEESETSSEDYSPSDNSSSYTSGSVPDWTICSPSPIPSGQFDRPPALPSRVLESRPFSPSSTSSSSSSSTSGYVPHRLAQPAPSQTHYMHVNRSKVDAESEYMTMELGLKRVQLTAEGRVGEVETDEDSGYMDMHSAGRAYLENLSPDDIPPESVEQYMRMAQKGDGQTATLTRNRSEPLIERSSTPPLLPPHASSRLREFDILDSYAATNSNTFPGTKRT